MATSGGVTESPWDILGVKRGAPKDAIRAQYKKLVAAEHPDKHPGDKAAAGRFKRITVAYQELIDDLARPPQEQAQPPGPDRESTYAETLEDLGVSVKDFRRFLGGMSSFALWGFAVFVLVFGYSLFLGNPEDVVKTIFPAEEKSLAGDADLIRLGLKDSDSVKEYYRDLEAKFGARDAPQNLAADDREWLQEKEQLLEEQDSLAALAGEAKGALGTE